MFSRRIIYGFLATVAVGVVVAYALLDRPDETAARVSKTAIRSVVCPAKPGQPAGYFDGHLQSFCFPISMTSLPVSGLSVTFHPTERDNGLRIGRVNRVFYYCHDASGNVMAVPTSYMTNFASIPAGARWLLQNLGDQTEAAVVHDWLYSVGEDSPSWNREQADLVFHDILVESKVNYLKRNLMYRMLRLAGGSAYNTKPMIEMRRENWAKFELPRPKTAIVDKLPACKGFMEKYGLNNVGMLTPDAKK